MYGIPSLYVECPKCGCSTMDGQGECYNPHCDEISLINEEEEEPSQFELESLF